MSIGSNRFTLKIIISYLVLGALAVFVAVFLYNELKEEIRPSEKNEEEKKFVQAGTLINSLYETDSFSNIALLTLEQEDFNRYVEKNDTLFKAIDNLKELTSKEFQKKQLDSIKILLEDKKENIAELRELKIANSEDTSLDAILQEFKNLETNIGILTVENFVENPEDLSKKELRTIKEYVSYMNKSRESDDPTVRAGVLDSMLAATRYIVSGAKRNTSRLRASLLEKENELIRNDLNISAQLRRIIYDFDAEISRKQLLDNIQKEASVARSSRVLRIAAVSGAIIILLFSYWLITDFFRAERLKNKLQKEKQTTESLLRSREQLISTVSHDLKTPLSTIAGYTELFKNTPLNDKQTYYTEHISASTTYITKLADDLLDLSKLEAGKIRPEKIPFSLKNLIHQVGEGNKQLHKDKPVALVVDFDPALENTIFESDPIRIQQIVNNLISNAFKFTHEGSVTVTVGIAKPHDNKPEISIAVTDTGIGINKEKQDLIFQEFTQAEADTAEKFGGSGLGLTISKKLTKLLGGILQLESEVGEGSTFTLQIPLAVSKRVVEATKEKATALSNLKAIILDDDTAMLSMLKELFEHRGLEVTTFNSFKDIIKTGTLDFDFLLTDMQMPDYSGTDVLYDLQQGALPSYSNQPVILMTGNRNFSEDYYLERGFSAMLQKPFTTEQLEVVLKGLFPAESGNGVGSEAEEEMGVLPETATYNLNMLQSFLGSKKAMQEVLQVFFLQTDTNMQEIRSGIRNKDFLSVSNTAHKMLTMCRQLQAKRVVPILENLEKYHIAKAPKTIIEVLEKNLTEEIALLVQDLREV